MAVSTISTGPEAVQEKGRTLAELASAPVSAPSAPPSSEAQQEEKKPVGPAPAASTGGVDREAIARVVENVLAAQGIARGSGAHKSVPVPPPAAKQLASPSSIAAEIADRFFGSSAKPKTEIAAGPSAASSGAIKTAEELVPSTPVPNVGKKPEPPAQVAIEVQVFVSENDVRRAMTRSEKIFIGRKTILTPSARDLGLEHEVFVETEAGSIR